MQCELQVLPQVWQDGGKSGKRHVCCVKEENGETTGLCSLLVLPGSGRESESSRETLRTEAGKTHCPDISPARHRAQCGFRPCRQCEMSCVHVYMCWGEVMKEVQSDQPARFARD